MTAFPSTLPPGTGQKHLILLGAGQSHLDVLTQWAVRPVAGVQVSLVTPLAQYFHKGMLPGLVTGLYAPEDCVTALEPLIHNSGIRRITRHAAGIDTQTQTILLDDGSRIHYDWLSINTGLTQDRSRIEQSIPGAREFGLFVRPPEGFVSMWPRVMELPADVSRSVAVIGGDTTGIELAMAIRYCLPNSAVTLITGGNPVASHLPGAIQQRVERMLKKQNITVLIDWATGLQRGEALLGCGARLACDIPILNTGIQAPSWLVKSGLTLDDTGLVVVDACQRSTSHANVFAAGSVSTLAGDAGLGNNLAGAVSGMEPRPVLTRKQALQLLSCGRDSAIAGWHGLSVQGRLVAWWKERSDRRLAHRWPQQTAT